MADKDWTGNKSCAYSTVGATNHSLKGRADNDYYATDPFAVELLLEKERFCTNIWECACGQGHISKVLQKHGHDVLSTDLIDRGFGIGNVDFLKEETLLKTQNCFGEYGNYDIVTNPPYAYAEEFVRQSLKVIGEGHKCAMLLRLLFLESKKRRKLFDDCNPKIVYVPSSRFHCGKNGDFSDRTSNAICYAWFVWEKGYMGDTIIRWIN